MRHDWNALEDVVRGGLNVGDIVTDDIIVQKRHGRFHAVNVCGGSGHGVLSK